MRLVVLLVWLVACAEIDARSSHTSAKVRPSCEVDISSLRCGQGTHSLDALGVAMPLRSSARRHGGGLWLLDAAGDLLRVDARARRTAAFPTDFVTLVDAGGLVCGLRASGSVRCLADHPGDVRCGEAAPMPDAEELEVTWRRLSVSDSGRLCGLDVHGAWQCFGVSRPCARACLQFPDCDAPLRCADPCAPGQASISFITQPGSGDK